MDATLAALQRRIKDPQITAMILVLVAGALLILTLGKALAPVLTAVVVAYLLEGMVRHLTRWGAPRPLSVGLVFGLFLLLMLAVLFLLMPALAQQLTKLLGEIPRITGVVKSLMRAFAESASGLVNPAFAENLLVRLVEASQNLAADTVTYLLQSIPGLLSVFVYLFLVPFLVFFFLKDKEVLLAGFRRFLPKERNLLMRVLRNADYGMAGYIRGKFLELLLLGGASYVVFTVQGVEYAFLLALLTGLSVLIPFLGVAVATVPVVVLGLVQWGISIEAMEPFIAYTVLQILDGSIVAPLILGESCRLHPTLIMGAVLLFGFFWGVLGVFFAVPLAVLVKSILEAIPAPTPNHAPLVPDAP